ncbi:transposase [Streptomyces xiangluensis]|uniref:Transposase n=1 Tax=Streptomyces xiangluensis TaxID=2665720 RepID=A0ABV8YQT8_9ACTN
MYACRRTSKAVIVDSQSLRMDGRHRRRRPTSDGQGGDGGKKVAGRKGHVAVDLLGLLLVVLATAASVQGRDAGIPLLSRLRSMHRRSDRLTGLPARPLDGVTAGTVIA